MLATFIIIICNCYKCFLANPKVEFKVIPKFDRSEYNRQPALMLRCLCSICPKIVEPSLQPLKKKNHFCLLFLNKITIFLMLRSLQYLLDNCLGAVSAAFFLIQLRRLKAKQYIFLFVSQRK